MYVYVHVYIYTFFLFFEFFYIIIFSIFLLFKHFINSVLLYIPAPSPPFCMQCEVLALAFLLVQRLCQLCISDCVPTAALSIYKLCRRQKNVFKLFEFWKRHN